MLSIRMQRTGRKGHAQFRVVVQDSRFSPSSGRVVAYLGSYDPHAKATTLDKEKVQSYLTNGAQPSERVAKLLKAEGVKLPSWVNLTAPKERSIRNQDKLRRNRPPEEKAAEPAADEAPAPTETPAEEPAEAPADKAEPEVAPDTEVPAEATPETEEAAAEPEVAVETPAETAKEA